MLLIYNTPINNLRKLRLFTCVSNCRLHLSVVYLAYYVNSSEITCSTLLYKIERVFFFLNGSV